jgi:hypothetical protein
LDSSPRGNDLDSPVPKLCLALEEDRRTPEGRTRSSTQFREHYFAFDERGAADRIFVRLPNDVRGPILAAWGVRGPKSAVKDTDEKVRDVVWDALVAGDLDDFFFEEGLAAAVVVRWVDLADWWSFWRTGPLTKRAVRRALERAHDLGLFDAAWFLGAIEARGGASRGVTALAQSLGKDELVRWIAGVHASGDASPSGLVAALGWEAIVTTVADDVLLRVLDALAAKIGLASVPAPPPTRPAEPEPTWEVADDDVDSALSGMDLPPVDEIGR